MKVFRVTIGSFFGSQVLVQNRRRPLLYLVLYRAHFKIYYILLCMEFILWTIYILTKPRKWSKFDMWTKLIRIRGIIFSQSKWHWISLKLRFIYDIFSLGVDLMLLSRSISWETKESISVKCKFIACVSIFCNWVPVRASANSLVTELKYYIGRFFKSIKLSVKILGTSWNNLKLQRIPSIRLCWQMLNYHWEKNSFLMTIASLK